MIHYKIAPIPLFIHTHHATRVKTRHCAAQRVNRRPQQISERFGPEPLHRPHDLLRLPRSVHHAQLRLQARRHQHRKRRLARQRRQRRRQKPR